MKKIRRQTITNKTKILIPLLFLSLTLLLCLNTVSATSGNTIYVNASSGNDSWNGQSATWISGTKTGPKLSIKNATGTINTGGTINIANGQYRGENNTNITISKNMVVIGQNQKKTVINGTGTNWIFKVNSGVTLTIMNLTLSNGNNTRGGAIENYGNLTVNDCIFTSNTAGWDGTLTNYGGAINNQGTLTANKCIFNNNSARVGGAIYNSPNSTLKVNNSMFIDNIGKLGGSIYNHGSSIVKGSIFTNNTAQKGGAIFNLNYDLLLNIDNCIFTNNSAAYNFGGAIYNNAGNVTVTGSIFTDNSASNKGGAVYNEGLFKVISCIFKGNTADYGGAIYNWDTLNIKGSTFTSNNASMSGGAIYNIKGILNVTNSTFMQNNATQGGAIYNNCTSTVNGCIFNNNSIYAINDAIGGAICNIGNLTVANSAFNNNSASGSSNVMGGAIGNLCRVSNSSSSSVSCTVTNCTFKGNSAQSGGAIGNSCQVINSSSGSVNCTITNCKFTGNTATDWEGGAISNRYYVRGGSGFTNCTVTGCIFTNNTATNEGHGGALSNGGSTLNANFNRFYNNTATYGNAFYCNGGSVDANYNWWSSNKDPKTIPNLIYDDDNLVDACTWVILTVKANPTTIYNTQKSAIKADFNHINGGGKLIGGHIPDGPLTLDIPWGSFTSSTITHSITKNTVDGVMIALFYANEGTVPSVNPIEVTATADGYTTNNTESTYITVNKTSELYIKTTSNNNNPKIGETFKITYKLGNYGPDTAKNVTITFQLPEGLDLINISVDNGKCTYNETTRTVTWTLDSVPVGDPYLYLTVNAAGDGTYKITPSITTTTYNLNSGDDGIITINVRSNSDENTVNAASKTTIGLQDTGLPLNYLILAILLVLSGLVPKRK
ncbi:beta strand repeat-containing protein [Methanobacterium sp.]|uniref:beta strand repeat-containing protein n=1 Tax=Methanobacterium sp. TaxID=2164 RepID=UPI003C749611